MNNKLGEFIRAHRERVKPKDIGLPVGERRRTPGLRREELAQLCEVSPTWLTWLEQGRPVSASSKMLCKLADVMHLTVAERAYLFRLADKLDPNLSLNAGGLSEGLNSIVKAIKVPAYILNRQWDVVEWNLAAEDLFTGWLDRRGLRVQPNLLQFMFCEQKARKLIVDWPDRAKRLVAEFRADCGKYTDQEPLVSLIDALAQSSSEFQQMWSSQNVVDREGGTRRFFHPVKNELTFDQMNFYLAKRHDLKLVMLLPT
ncbi:MAG: helix-turn-helix domain-containing protein [Glaciimonas sp.]|nr:helix-turn-helix domain-containing protein [Glaciimonas sp.]